MTSKSSAFSYTSESVPANRTDFTRVSEVELPRFSGRYWAAVQSLLQMIPFVVDRRPIVERRVAPMGVVPPFNEVEDRHAGLDLGLETTPVNQLAFERGEKTFAHGVVETV